MRAALDDPALVDDDHLVGALGGGEPVGDGDRGAPAHQPLEGAADPHLEGRVDGAGGLVEDQQVGVGELGPQQRDQLALARRQRLAALADPGLEPARQAGQPVAEAELVGAGADLVVGGLEPAVADVGGEGVVEEEALLRHQHDAAAQRRPGRSRARRRRRAAPRPSVGSISRVSSLAIVDLPEPVSPTTAIRVPAAMSRSIVAQHRRAAGVGEADVARTGRRSGRAAGRAPSGPGSTRSAGVSRMPITRRQPAIAFWASVRIWVPICTGPTNSVTRNANASTLPAVMSLGEARARCRRSAPRRWRARRRRRRGRTRTP